MKNKIKYLPIGILTITTALAGVGLSSARVLAAANGSKDASVTVTSACTFSGSASSTDVAITAYAGSTTNTESDSSKGMMSVTCNNPDGFSVQAQGFSYDSEGEVVEGTTSLYGGEGVTPIATGTADTAGSNSYWAFRVSSAFSTTTYAIQGNYGTYSEVPGTPTDIIKFAGTTSNTIMALFRTDYQLHVSSTQPSGSYQGGVKYIIDAQ